MRLAEVGTFEVRIVEGGSAKIGASQIKPPTFNPFAGSFHFRSTDYDSQHRSDVRWWSVVIRRTACILIIASNAQCARLARSGPLAHKCC